jgi:hypothetical protein
MEDRPDQIDKPSIAYWRDHSGGASRRWVTPMPRGSRPSRGAPHNGLALPIRRIKARIFVPVLGRPGRRDRQRQWSRNPLRCHCTTVAGLTNTIASMTCGQSRATPTAAGRAMKAEADRNAVAAGRSPDVTGGLVRFQRGESGRRRSKQRRRESSPCRDGTAGPRKSPVFLSLVEI